MTKSKLMGNQRELIHSGGFSQYLYEDHPRFKPMAINGVRGKVIHYIADGKKDHTGLPQYSNKSDMYFRVGKDGNVVQGKVYVDRRHSIDFDWSHNHKNITGNGLYFPIGLVHVQVYETDARGDMHRVSDNARYMTEYEIEKYGPIIHALNPSVRFRP